MDSCKQLTALRPGDHGHVESVTTDDRDGIRLLELGLLPGAPVRFLRSAPMGDPMQVQVSDTCLSLRRRDAAGIRVRLAS